MGARQRVWAAAARERLFDELGRVCRWCGATHKEAKLTFDCIVPTQDGKRGHHQIEFSWRMSFYRAQHAAGNLQVLCLECNSRKSDAVTFREMSPLQRYVDEILNGSYRPEWKDEDVERTTGGCPA